MAPARSNRRTHHEQPTAARDTQPDSTAASDAANELFLEPMMGTPLTVYIEKDVDDRDTLIELVTKHGGAVSPGYSGTPYILVDPHKESGQNLYRQYAGKKGKIVLHYRWVHECIRAGALQTFQNHWAGCKVTGTEKANPPVVVPSQNRPDPSTQVAPMQPITSHPQGMPPMPPTDPLVHPSQASYGYPVYGHPMPPPARGIQPPTAAPPQSWQGPNAIAPQQTHMAPPQPPPMLPRPGHPYRDGPWVAGFDQPPPHMVTGPSGPAYDYRYRDDQPEWAQAPPNEYPYGPPYEQSYEQPPHYMPEAGPSTAGLSNAPAESAVDKPRGRKRTRNQGTPAAPPSTLVLNRKNPLARSPTPPTRVIKSTYGGNLFTSDDVLYLKRYIDYCQEQGLVLSLREICERIAVKAPHHTFYSWRRYCNKHQIRLGGYSMDVGDSATLQEGEGEGEQEPEGDQIRVGTGASVIAAAQQRLAQDGNQPRNRSPTPPRALFRSTTGKGVAFTDEDVTFLVKFMEYRKSQDRFDMVAFWKDVATKAPHHSRASWMKFWRRHKHELNRTEDDDPLPQPPEKKMRYSRSDDILLAKYFFHKPEGTSDRIFQAFGRLHPHHPWKGWQEHHRIHKAKIDHFIQQLANGENIDVEVDESTDQADN
ncbi:hypothetical protein F5I97DRAFT_1855699 [Phlebopus sp. FC_14]|nr:hypothetical protein F5I97DRAFT_1855699 [Phlebopus sp. FC_14]